MRLFIVLLFVLLSGCASIEYRQSEEQHLSYVSYVEPLPSLNNFDIPNIKSSLEFCLDLDSQDDLNFDRHDPNSIYIPITTGWTKIYDSRGEDLNPVTNGISPFENAWTLWKKDGEATYAIAIRGTVIESKPSVIEDAIISTIPAIDGIEYPKGSYPYIKFAELPFAEVHAGFAYASFVTLFDKDRGILPHLSLIPSGSTVIITGHSQGAAMGTLIHSFLYYAMHDGKYGLTSGRYNLISYLFAQPKPGNEKYAYDFNLIANNSSWVFNNILDPIPRVPETTELPQDAYLDMPQTGSKLNRDINRVDEIVGQNLKKLSGIISQKTSDRIANHEFYYSDILKNGNRISVPAESQYFVAAGNIVALLGHYDGKYYSTQPVDDFIQHHATTYRYLLNERYR